MAHQPRHRTGRQGHDATGRLRNQAEEQIFQRGIGATGLGTQFLERAFGDDAAALNDADAVDQPFCDLHDVGRENDGAAGAGPLQQQVLHFAGDRRIEPGQRLIQDQQPRFMQQCAGQCGLLLHPA